MSRDQTLHIWLIFDTILIYIMDMECWNDIKFNLITILAFLSCGMCVPVLFKNEVFIALCMIPFYGYLLYKCFVLSETRFPDCKIKRYVECRFYVSLLIIILVNSIVSLAVGLNYVSLALLLNSVVSFFVALVVSGFALWSFFCTGGHGGFSFWIDDLE